MPEIVDSTTTPAPPEEVWKLLYDPARFSAWWEGLERTEPRADGRVLFEVGADAPLLQQVTTDASGGRVVVSCMVYGLRFQWSLEPLEGGGTRITGRCTLPEHEAERREAQRAVVAASLRRLAELAATAAPPGRG